MEDGIKDIGAESNGGNPTALKDEGKAEGKSNQGAWKCKITLVAIAYCM
jgi:hypothetical protein